MTSGRAYKGRFREVIRWQRENIVRTGNTRAGGLHANGRSRPEQTFERRLRNSLNWSRAAIAENGGKRTLAQSQNPGPLG